MGRYPCCDKSGLKKGPWTAEEDSTLVDFIRKNGHGSWRILPKRAGLNRCGKSCRRRWTNFLGPYIKRQKFSNEEGQIIFDLGSVLGNNPIVQQTSPELEDNELYHYYCKGSQWLRTPFLRTIDGLVCVASLMMGVAAVQDDTKAMILTGFAGLVGSACGIAIGEYISAGLQLDMEAARMEKREKERAVGEINKKREKERLLMELLPSHVKAAATSGLAFTVGGTVPLLAGSFIKYYKVRMGVVVVVSNVALVVFGCLGAALWRGALARSAIRVFIGGWLAIAITFGLTKLPGLAEM